MKFISIYRENYGFRLICLFQQINLELEKIERIQAEQDIKRRLRIIKHAKDIVNVAKACRYLLGSDTWVTTNENQSSMELYILKM